MTFSVENYKASGRWELKALIYALLGMFIDAIGIIITRYAFDMNENLTGFEGNFYRCLGALFAYILISRYIPINFIRNFRSLKFNGKFMATAGAIFGTLISLALYLEAIKMAHLASISAISITSVIFTSLFESVWNRKFPSRYLWAAFCFFALGMFFLLPRW